MTYAMLLILAQIKTESRAGDTLLTEKESQINNFSNVRTVKKGALVRCSAKRLGAKQYGKQKRSGQMRLSKDRSALRSTFQESGAAEDRGERQRVCGSGVGLELGCGALVSRSSAISQVIFCGDHLSSIVYKEKVNRSHCCSCHINHVRSIGEQCCIQVICSSTTTSIISGEDGDEAMPRCNNSSAATCRSKLLPTLR